MGWTTLTLRKAELRREHATLEKRNLQISREKRQMARQLHLEQTRVNNDKTYELKNDETKTKLDELKANRKKTSDPDYADWQNEYMQAKEDYEAFKVDTNEYYDGILSDLEEESADREALLEQEQTEIEALMEDITNEISSLDQSISSQIKSTTIKIP